MRYITRQIRYPDGTSESIRVPLSKINKEITKLIKENKLMFDILAEL